MLVKILFGFAIALFLTYPASILTTIIEGKSAAAIYSNHFWTSWFCYLIFVVLIFSFLRHFSEGWNLRRFQIKVGITILVLGLIVVLYGFFVFWDLGKADIVNDDYDLAYQAYNLQDGMAAARKAYVISYNTHPPLFMSIKHYWFQIAFPNGLETVPAWGYRTMEGILGIATILAVYVITKNYWASAILAVNNYMIMMGRVYLREMYLTFFLTLSIYFFEQKKYLVTAFLIGCGVLIKTSSIIILPAYLLILLWRREFRNVFKMISILFAIYFPVILYNCLAYVTTGHMDATFSKIFGLAHPFLTGSASPVDNFKNIVIFLKDLYGLPVLIIFIFSLINKNNLFYVLIFIFSLLYFVFGGPLREYYLLFLTVPFAITTAKLPRIIPIAVIILSLFVKSKIREIYEPIKGWPSLVNEVKAIYWPGDCLEKGFGVNDLAMRAYFQTDDQVKSQLLGEKYYHEIKMCNETTEYRNKIQIFYNQQNQIVYQIL